MNLAVEWEPRSGTRYCLTTEAGFVPLTEIQVYLIGPVEWHSTLTIASGQTWPTAEEAQRATERLLGIVR